ncbi:DnaD domain-containing protein [Bacillus sp. N9]
MDKQLMLAWIEAGTIQIPQLLMNKYRQIGLDEKELVLLLQIISFAEKGNEFPTPEQLAHRMTMTSEECSMMLRKLVQAGFIQIEDQSKDGVGFEKYSLAPLWLKLIDDIEREQKQASVETALIEEQNLYTLFEQEFGRPLSPLECESLAMWIDQDKHDPVLIKAALREAVLSGKLNFRYVDRILFEWKKNGIVTLEQARVQALKFRQKANRPDQKPVQSSNAVPFYNWLEQ